GIVDLDCRHPRRRPEQAERERSEAWPDLEHMVVGAQSRGGDDSAHGVRVDDEVLAALLGRTDAVPPRKLAHVCGSDPARPGHVAAPPRPPNAAAVLASIARHSVSRSSPRASAMARTVSGTR